MAQLPSLLSDLPGKRVTYLARVLYEHAGDIELGDGPLEFGVDGQILLLDGDADGESLRVRDGAWHDPFEESRSEENQRYVEEHGKWRRVVCSQEDAYSDLIGQTITDVCALANEAGRIAGVRISVPGRTLWFVVEGDESHVYWARPLGFKVAKG